MELKLTSFSREKFLEENLKSLSKDGVMSNEIFFLLDKGFSVEEVRLFSLNKSNYHDYLPKSNKYKLSLATNCGYWPILHDKMLFYHFVQKTLPTPRLYALIFNGKLMWENNVDFSFDYSVTTERKFVLKPLQGGEGQGIFFLKFSQNLIYLDGVSINKHELESFVTGFHKYGIFEFVEQHSTFNEMYAESINTIRMLTMRDRDSGTPYIYMSILRVGWAESRPFDNFNKGGLVALIDHDSGVVSKWKRKDSNGNVTEGRLHPDTNFNFEGFAIPNWREIKDKMLDFLNSKPFFDCVGWDIIVTQDNFSVIEGNHNPGLNSSQIFKGFFSDKRNVDLFKSLGIYE